MDHGNYPAGIALKVANMAINLGQSYFHSAKLEVIPYKKSRLEAGSLSGLFF
jgi:hypothetical protein